MDRLERRIIQLKIEREALKKESDDASKKRLEDLEAQLGELEKRVRGSRGGLEVRESRDAGHDAHQGRARARALELETAHRANDLARMSELQYGRIPELEKQLEDAVEAERAQETTLLRNNVTDEEVAEIVSKWTGIPVSKMLEGEKEKLLQMEAVVQERVVGQDEAVVAVANAIRRSRAGLRSARPIGSFLFLGPTGVGKTELTKALANFLFDTDDAMVRLDMSEFMEKHSVAR